MSKHTPEPWVVVRNTAYWEIGTEIDGYYATRIGDVCATDPSHADSGKQEANATRIVACVNACAGMDDPAAEIERLRARVAELEGDRDRWKAIAEKRHAIIESLEWCMDSMDDDGTFRRCPTCSAFEPETHESDCAVAKAIAESTRAANEKKENR